MNPFPGVGKGERTVGSICACTFCGLCSKKLGCPSVRGFSSGVVFDESDCGCGDVRAEPGAVISPFSDELPLPVPSPGAGMRLTFFEARLVGRSVHLRFRPAQRLQGNFLSHFVFVLAQLLHAIGVLPADLGIIPLLAGKPS